MARNPKQRIITKKHLARQQREQLQQRYILITAAVVAVLVIGLIAYGILDQTYLQAIRPVATVNGERITTREFQAQTRYARQRLVGNALQTLQFMQYFGSSPETQASFQSQLFQIQSQLVPETVGQQVIDMLVEDALIRQEAEKRGITVTQEEIDLALQEGFGFFPDGTPTPRPTLEPVPTSTLNPTQRTLVPPTATPTVTPTLSETTVLTETATLTETETLTGTEALTATPAIATDIPLTPTVEPTVTPTLAPTATATPYTLEGYQAEYQKALDSLQEEINFTEQDLRYVVEMQLYREKLQEAVLAGLDISREQEQVWTRHIQVVDEATAKTVLERLDAGEDWGTVAAELTTDTFTQGNAGDLGWLSREELVDRFGEIFAETALGLETGEISQPVQTEVGWHIIQGLGHEVRTLDDADYEALRQQKFSEWLDELRSQALIEVDENWVNRVPVEPTLPPEVSQILQQPIAPIQEQPQPTP